MINPNTSKHVTNRLQRVAQQAVNGMAPIRAFTADTGPAIMSSRSENAIALSEMLRLAESALMTAS